jgi:hypothetical protein
MPVDVRILTSRKEQPLMFKKFSRKEIEDSWEGSSYTLRALKESNEFVIFLTKNKIEAIVVAAMFVRELATRPHCTYYDKDVGALMLFYGGTVSKKEGRAYAKERTMGLVERLMEKDIIRITKDSWGEELFWHGY